MGKIAGVLGLDEKSKFIESGKMGQRVTSLPNLALLTPFGMPFLLPHLKNSFFPSKEKEVVPETSTSGGGGTDEVEVSGGEEGGEEITTALVETPDNSDAVIDDSGESGGESTTAQLAESDTSSASSSVSNVSSQTTYEELPSGTVLITEEPKRSEFSSEAQYQQALMFHMNQKELLNNLYKTKVKASLYKI